MSFPHEEEHELGPFWSWVAVILLCVAIVVWGTLNWMLIRDAPRQWDTGALRDVPGQSVYSTASPGRAAAVPGQIAPLPEGKPVKKDGQP